MIGEQSPPVPQDIKRVSSTKFLGLVVDDKLSFNEHIDHICGELAKRIGILKRIRNCQLIKGNYTITLLLNLL